jgi:hypothetical protein
VAFFEAVFFRALREELLREAVFFAAAFFAPLFFAAGREVFGAAFLAVVARVVFAAFAVLRFAELRAAFFLVPRPPDGRAFSLPELMSLLKLLFCPAAVSSSYTKARSRSSNFSKNCSQVIGSNAPCPV